MPREHHINLLIDASAINSPGIVRDPA